MHCRCFVVLLVYILLCTLLMCCVLLIALIIDLRLTWVIYSMLVCFNACSLGACTVDLGFNLLDLFWYCLLVLRCFVCSLFKLY